MDLWFHYFPPRGLSHRLDCVRKLRWDAGPVIPPSLHHDILSIREKEYFSKYNEIITDYIEELGLDVTAYLEVRTKCAVTLTILLLLLLSIIAAQRFANWNKSIRRLWGNIDRKWADEISEELYCVRQEVSLDGMYALLLVSYSFRVFRSAVESFIKEGKVEHISPDGEC